MILEKGRIKEFKPVLPSQEEPAQEISGYTEAIIKMWNRALINSVF